MAALPDSVIVVPGRRWGETVGPKLRALRAFPPLILP